MTLASTRRLADNLLSSYAYLGFTALVLVLLVPVYVGVLGASAWGAVAWCLTLQGVLFGLDVLLAPLLLREVARAGSAAGVQVTYARFLRRYGTLALAIVVVGQIALLLPTIAEALSPSLRWALRLALLQFLFQFANNAAIGVWHGLQRQRFANLRLAGFAALKHAFALGLVLGWRATPEAYFLPFVLVAAIEFVVNRRRIAHESTVIDGDGVAAVEPPDRIAGFAAAMALGLLSAHLDRIVLSLVLDAATYGIYFLVGTLMLSLLHLQMPIARVFLPHMATTTAPRRVARDMLRVSVPLLVLPCLAIAALPERVLLWWLHDAAVAATGAAPLRVMAVAVALLALYSPTSALLVRERRWRSLATINATVLMAQIVVLLVLLPRIGMLAGAWAWLAAGVVQLACVPWLWRGVRDGD